MKKIFYLCLFLCTVCSGYALSSMTDTEWVFVEGIEFNGVIGPSPNEKLLGKKIKYYQSFIEFDGKQYPIKQIQKEEWTSEDLYNETRGLGEMGSRGLTFKDFNYSGDKLTVLNYRVESQEYTPARSDIFLINDKEAIMLHDAYYRLKRIK